MNENVWSLSIKDFFTKKMLGYALVPFLGTIVVMYALFFSLAGAGLDALAHDNASLQIEQHRYSDENGIVNEEHNITTVEGGSAILRFLMEHTVTSWLVSFIVYTVGGLFTFLFAMIIALVIIGFLTPYIVAEIKRRHYPTLSDEHHGSTAGIILASLKHTVIMIVLLLVLMPLYFIPLVNLIAFNVPFYYFFHKMYLLDVASETMSKERFKEVMFYKGGNVRVTTLTLYVLTLLPFAAYVTPVFNVIVLTHTLLRNRLYVETNRPQSVPASGAHESLPGNRGRISES